MHGAKVKIVNLLLKYAENLQSVLCETYFGNWSRVLKYRLNNTAKASEMLQPAKIFYVSLNVHLSITLDIDQFDARFF
jgi:hypothetical protein